jgi:hypothetical protein
MRQWLTKPITSPAALNKWAKRVGVGLVGLVCAVVATVAVLWCVPPAPRITPENVAKLTSRTTEAEAIAIFGRPYFKGPFENDGESDGRNLVWIEDREMFSVRLGESGTVIGIRWDHDMDPEGFWHKLRRRLRL